MLFVTSWLGSPSQVRLSGVFCLPSCFFYSGFSAFVVFCLLVFGVLGDFVLCSLHFLSFVVVLLCVVYLFLLCGLWFVGLGFFIRGGGPGVGLFCVLVSLSSDSDRVGSIAGYSVLPCLVFCAALTFLCRSGSSSSFFGRCVFVFALVFVAAFSCIFFSFVFLFFIVRLVFVVCLRCSFRLLNWCVALLVCCLFVLLFLTFVDYGSLVLGVWPFLAQGLVVFLFPSRSLLRLVWFVDFGWFLFVVLRVRLD